MLDMQYTPDIDGKTPADAGAEIMAKKWMATSWYNLSSRGFL